VMRRPPRRPDARLLSRDLVGWSVVQGAVALTLVTTVALAAMRRDMPHEEIRALVFVSLVALNVGLVFVNRGFGASLRALLERSNAALWVGVAITSGVLAIILAVPSLRGFFGLGPLHTDDLMAAAAVATVLLIVLQLVKRRWGSRLAA
ncbi:MAG: cation transporting ATPase C-terminal domain-containing protein, partial [Steroidobacteraceae bacterium]